MKVTIDEEGAVLVLESGGERRSLPLYSKEAFEVLSRQWLRVGWSQKYSYTFTWMGRPVIQLPEDMIRMQEAVWSVGPDVILETGVAHGGSLIFHASLCKAMGKGRVIGVDIEIRPANRQAIESHCLSSYITLIEGSSVDPGVVDRVKSLVAPGETVMAFLDSNHTKDHVARELDAYHGMITPGSYIVVTDGIMRDLHDVPGGRPEWAWDNPAAAAREFIVRTGGFALEEPPFLFNESGLDQRLTHSPDAWLKRLP